jgi:uncharacterized protein YuzE
MPTRYETRYDEPADALTIKESDAKIQRSVSIGNMTVDMDSEGKVIGIQLLNASEVVVFPEEVESATEFLKNIQEADLRTKYFEDGSTVIIAKVNTKQNGKTLEGILNTQTPAVTA